jgi:methylmalonyl-CoA/ethylmalonyl-CoA epimerase
MRDTENHGEETAKFLGIDHIALAVKDLEQAIKFFSTVLGFELRKRLEVKGNGTGMVSAQMEHNGLKFVLCQGTEPTSQVSRLIDNFGPGVAHIALAVDDVDATERQLRANGMNFDTNVIRGEGLTQVFSSRDPNSGMSFEFICRNGATGFVDDNVQQLFEQLEKAGAY